MFRPALGSRRGVMVNSLCQLIPNLIRILYEGFETSATLSHVIRKVYFLEIIIVDGVSYLPVVEVAPAHVR